MRMPCVPASIATELTFLVQGMSYELLTPNESRRALHAGRDPTFGRRSGPKPSPFYLRARILRVSSKSSRPNTKWARTKKGVGAHRFSTLSVLHMSSIPRALGLQLYKAPVPPQARCDWTLLHPGPVPPNRNEGTTGARAGHMSHGPSECGENFKKTIRQMQQSFQPGEHG